MWKIVIGWLLLFLLAKLCDLVTSEEARNITSNKSHDSFGWVKMVKGVSNCVKGFPSAEEAALDMERFYAGVMPGGM